MVKSNVCRAGLFGRVSLIVDREMTGWPQGVTAPGLPQTRTCAHYAHTVPLIMDSLPPESRADRAIGGKRVPTEDDKESLPRH